MESRKYRNVADFSFEGSKGRTKTLHVGAVFVERHRATVANRRLKSRLGEQQPRLAPRRNSRMLRANNRLPCCTQRSDYCLCEYMGGRIRVR